MPQPDHPEPPDCGGRFSVQAFLGAGGMGAVFEAYDHQRQSLVAMKVIRRAGGPWIYRFKQEFRSLAGVVHPNLVTLHELIEWEGQWLFTMERVPGLRFDQALRMAGRPTPPGPPPDTGRPGTTDVHAPETPSSDADRVSDALRQLCDGIDFLHGRGVAHGDIKPANVLINPDSRVVILDFGLARNWRTEEDDDWLPTLGTPGYLAPERLDGGAASPASDMFAVGVVLFEILTGQGLANEPDPEARLRASRTASSSRNGASPRRELLEQLCLRLVDPDPAARPTAAEVRDAIGLGPGRVAQRAAARLTRSVEEPPFVAREAELEAVRNALLDPRAQAPHVVLVSGDSGIGKTELLRRIVDEQLPSRCLVLEGKCYEREQVTYRALDRLVDALGAKLLGVDPDELQALAWADLAVVSRMFPALGRVPEIDRLAAKSLRADTRDPHEQRRAAATVLGRFLELVAEGRRLILYIEDLHWADEESGILLRELMQSTDTLDLRLVGSQRLDGGQSEFLDRLLEDGALQRLDVRLDALAPKDAERLARALLGPQANPDHVASVATESHGNPFLIRELVEFGAGQDRTELALRSAVARHVELLPPPARSILEVLAVAGQRLDIELVRMAASVGATFEAAIILLRSQHLVRASDLHGNQIEPYHDRIREGIVQELTPDALAAHHAELARALEELGDPDPARLGFHLEGAGERLRAAEALLLAAEIAELSLAPLNAATHYARVVTLTSAEDPRYSVALRGQARSLSAAGRTAQAGPLYLELAEGRAPDEALRLRRKAAESFVYAGEFEKARALLPRVLEEAGARAPRTLVGTLWGIAGHRLWLWRRHNRFTPTPEREIAPERLVRIDAFESAAELTSMSDLIRTFHLQSAHVHECLAAGEPRRVARALVETIVIGSIAGESRSRHGLELLRLAEEAAHMGDFPEEQALIRYAAGIHAVLNGRYTDVVDALGPLANTPDLRGAVSQLRTLRSVLGYARWWLGHWRTLAKEHRDWILDAMERGDRLAACAFRLEQSGQWTSVLDDEPERAAEELARALASPIGQELAFGHLAASQTRAWTALYMGRADEAERSLRFQGAERAYLRVQRSRVEIAVLHAYAALASGRRGVGRARSWMRRIDREGLAWADPIVRLIAASIAEQEGRRDESIAAAQVAASMCDRLGYRMFAAAVRWRLGELSGGDEGEALRVAAEARIAAEGAKRPDRIVRTLAPGFGDPLV